MFSVKLHSFHNVTAMLVDSIFTVCMQYLSGPLEVTNSTNLIIGLHEQTPNGEVFWRRTGMDTLTRYTYNFFSIRLQHI